MANTFLVYLYYILYYVSILNFTLIFLNKYLLPVITNNQPDWGQIERELTLTGVLIIIAIIIGIYIPKENVISTCVPTNILVFFYKFAYYLGWVEVGIGIIGLLMMQFRLYFYNDINMLEWNTPFLSLIYMGWVFILSALILYLVTKHILIRPTRFKYCVPKGW